MAFGNEECNYRGFACGEHNSIPKSAYEKESPHAHVDGLIGLDGKLRRAIKSEFGDRIGLTIRVTGDTSGVSEALQRTLTEQGVSFKAVKWEDVGREGKIITFRDIPTEQLPQLGKAVAEIEQNRFRQRQAQSL
jgi:hypothetical protein